MSEFLSDIRIQQSLALLLTSFTIAVFIAGIVIKKTKFFDLKNTKKSYSSKDSISHAIGKYMMIFSSILGLTTILIFFLSLLEN